MLYVVTMGVGLRLWRSVRLESANRFKLRELQPYDRCKTTHLTVSSIPFVLCIRTLIMSLSQLAHLHVKQG